MANTYDSKSVNGTGLSYFYNKIKALFVDKESIVDNLTTDDSTKVLSAKQGKVLSDTIDGITGGSGSVKKAEDADKLGGKAASLYGLADGTNIKPKVTAASTRANLATNDTLVTIVGKLAKWFTDLKTVAWTGDFENLTNVPNYALEEDLPSLLSAEFAEKFDKTGGTIEGNVVIGEDYNISIAERGYVAMADEVAGKYVAKTAMGGYLEPYAKSTDVTNTLKSYPTTTSMNSAISTALTPYAKKEDLANVYKYKGSKNSYADLPTSGNTAGDVWNVVADGINYAWTGSAWDDLGGLSEIDYITTGEIDQIMGITT